MLEFFDKLDGATVVAAISVLLAPLLLFLWTRMHRPERKPTGCGVSWAFALLIPIAGAILHNLFSSPVDTLRRLGGWLIALLIVETATITSIFWPYTFALGPVPAKERLEAALKRGPIFGLLGYATTFFRQEPIATAAADWWVTCMKIGAFSALVGSLLWDLWLWGYIRRAHRDSDEPSS